MLLTQSLLHLLSLLVISRLTLCNPHPQPESLAALEDRAVCPTNQATCGTSCCPPGDPPGTFGGLEYKCANAAKGLCCESNPSQLVEKNGICCKDYQSNCGGACCYGACVPIFSGIGKPMRYYCNPYKGPCNDASLACSVESDCTNAAYPHCPTGGGCCYSNPKA